MSKQTRIIITAAVAIGGKIIRPGTEVSVDGSLARNLLSRGRAELGDSGAEENLAALNDKQLKKIAADLGVEGLGKMDRETLIAEIEAALAAQTE